MKWSRVSYLGSDKASLCSSRDWRYVTRLRRDFHAIHNLVFISKSGNLIGHSVFNKALLNFLIHCDISFMLQSGYILVWKFTHYFYSHILLNCSRGIGAHRLLRRKSTYSLMLFSHFSTLFHYSSQLCC